MSILLVIILGAIQGITEFLPVSSSGHLVIFQQLLKPYLGEVPSPLAFDISLHLATVLAVIIFLWSDILKVLQNLFKKEASGVWSRQLAVTVILATLPAGVIGMLFKKKIELLFSSTNCALNGFILTAIILELAHRFQVKVGNIKNAVQSEWILPGYSQALLIGFAQAVAILPGVSRSGSTIAAALILGLAANSAVRFSFFLLIPVVLGAVVLESKELFEIGMTDSFPLAIAFVVTFIVAGLSLRVLLRLVSGAKLRYFALYTLSASILFRFFWL